MGQQEVLDLLKKKGCMHSSNLAKELNVSIASVQFSLRKLIKGNDVIKMDEKGVGRKFLYKVIK